MAALFQQGFGVGFLLRAERAIQDLKAAFHYLAARPDVGGKRIGAIGWSMGGGFAIQLAIHEPQLSACVVNYGALPTNPADIGNIKAPVPGNFGALDRGIPSPEVRTFERVMKSLNKSVDIKIYMAPPTRSKILTTNVLIALKLEPIRGTAFWPSSPRLREQM